MAAFEEFGVMPELGAAVEEMEWTLPTDVQAEAIPLILGGGDVLMAAETGSGKTGAFCLPVLQVTWESLKELQEGKGRGQVSGGAKEAETRWGMSFFDRGPALAVSQDGLRCQSREMKEWHGARATRGVVGGGKHYYEATVTDEGLCRVGVATGEASLDLGTCRHGFGFGGTGKKSNNKQFDSYGGSYGKADTIGVYLDLDNMEVWYSKNGEDLGQAFAISPDLRGQVFYPAVVLKNAEMLFNFGDSAFKHPPVEGYKGFREVEQGRLVSNPKGSGGAGVTERKKVNNAPQALIIEPSRELADQTYSQLGLFQAKLPSPGVSTLLLVGGVPAREQIAALKAGVDIVVATPGRLEDLVNTGELSLQQCRFFVLDEADGLLKGGYEPLINRLHGKVPKVTSDGRRLQMIVCSATLHAIEVRRMAERLMYFPTWVDLKGQDAVPETVHHVVVRVDPVRDQGWRNYGRAVTTDGVHARDGGEGRERLSEAVKVMKAEYLVKAIDEHAMDRGILFCRTKVDCDNLEQYLHLRGGGRASNLAYSCTVLHGDRKPQERKDNLASFKRMDVKFLICTDVAARGIDITGLPFMVNVTLPDEKSNYVHRIGRVGRAERMGLAISLVSTVPEKVWYHGQWCPSRGRGCSNTQLTEARGCCVWYDEPQYLADIEEHLGVTIQQAKADMKVAADEFDGKVVYGEKKSALGPAYEGHRSLLAPTLATLTELETQAQHIFLRNFYPPGQAA